jgi:hypothetical protein
VLKANKDILKEEEHRGKHGTKDQAFSRLMRGVIIP